jgi:hypothetical protein
MSPTPEERARGRALALRQELGLGHGAVDPVAVLRQRGVEVIRVPAEGIDGLYHREGGVSVVLINSGMPAIRQRMTAAHELGHDVLDGEGTDSFEVVDVNVFSATGRDKLMTYFGGAFLVDPFGVKELRAAGYEGADLIAQTVARFLVSVQSAGVKMGEIGQLDCDLVTADGVTTKNFMHQHGVPFHLPQPDPMPVDPERRRRVAAAFRAGLLEVDAAASYLHMSREETEFWLQNEGVLAPEPTDPLLLAERDQATTAAR